MQKMSLPSPPKKKLFKMETFRGCDFTNEPANVAHYRSPYAPNMIRESVGKVRKRTGYYVAEQYPGKINGVHYYFYEDGERKRLRIVHAGDKLYTDPKTVLYSGVGDTFSVSRQMGDKLIILDGMKALAVTDAETVQPLEDIAYVPTILIARDPTGGGELLDPVNLITPWRIVRFKGDATAKNYQLPSTDLDSDPVKVEKLNSSGAFDTLVEDTDFTVNRTTGVVSFNSAPGVSPVTGEDNIYITYAKTVEGYADKINHCDIVTLYGVGGARDRMFVSGDPKYPNQDYYSSINDPTYFGDLWYAVLGQQDSRIVGYSIINNSLATHKDRSHDDTNIFMRSGTLIDGEAAFPVSGGFQGDGAIAKHSFGVLETEPLFLTNNGIFAVTPADYSAERYAQNRSFYLNGKLLKESNMENAYSTIWNQMYVLALNGSLYILDGLQYSRENNEPFSRRQYECFYWTDIPARMVYDEDGVLWFGTEDGRLCAFYTDYGSLSSFSDNGEIPIASQWLTPEFYGDDFYADKSFTKIAVLVAAAVATGCRVWGIYDGERELLIDYDGSARFFSYEHLNYGKFSYSTDTTPQDLIERTAIRRVKKVQYLIENDVLNEPFGLYSVTAEFTERR